jgi:protein-S-isoprenylcysteine O-methyltransferase Ste14
MSISNTFVLLLGIICFVAFSWAVRGHFRSNGRLAPGMKLISGLSLIGALWFAVRVPVQGESLAWPLAVACFIAALWVFAWAILTTRRARPALAFENAQPDSLFREGPYRRVRHPFYLSYLLFWVGTAAATPGLLPWLVPAIMLAAYRHAALQEERNFQTSPMAAIYAAYRAQSGMFLPRPGALLRG